MFSKVSIIIPCYNTEKTLKDCLSAVFKLNKIIDFEVIAVDDGSTDSTMEIARSYPCKDVLSTNVNSGPARARNIGVENATGDLLFFTDADVVLKEDTLEKILKSFENNKIDCLTGVFAPENPFPDFFSQYKSLYCNFKYSMLPAFNTTAVNSAIMVIPKVIFEKLNGFDEKMKAAEDNDFAVRLTKQGYSTYIDHQLKVLHLKNFSFLSLLKNDYSKSKALAYIMLKNISTKSTKIKNASSDVSPFMILNMPLSYLILISFILSIFFTTPLLLQLSIGLIIIFIINNWSFWSYLLKYKSFLFIPGSIIFTILDYLVAGAAVGVEIISFTLNKNGEK